MYMYHSNIIFCRKWGDYWLLVLVTTRTIIIIVCVFFDTSGRSAGEGEWFCGRGKLLLQSLVGNQQNPYFNHYLLLSLCSCHSVAQLHPVCGVCACVQCHVFTVHVVSAHVY